MKGLTSITILCSLLTWTGIARAEVVSIGTTNGGALAQIGAAVSSVVSAKSDLQMRPQKMSGTQQYLTAVDLGRVEFGLANVMQYYMAASGTGLSADKVHENLRLVASLVPFVQGIVVRQDSGIKNVADLKGKRIPTGYGSAPLFQTFWEAFLANAGLSHDDVTSVPVASLPKSWDAFKEGQVDAVIAAAGSASVREMNTLIDGGIRFLPIEESEALLEALPRTQIEVIEPADGLAGVLEPTELHTYEIVMFAHADVADDVVYEVAKALAEGTEGLKSSGALWNNYRRESIGMDHQLDYHPGAKRYFEEVGLLND